MIFPLGAVPVNNNLIVGQHFDYRFEHQPPPVIAAPTGPVVSPLSSPVPDGTPTDAIYEAPDGSQWEYNPAIAEWQELSAANVVQAEPVDFSQYDQSLAEASSVALAPAPATATLTASVTPNWFTESTIWAAVPNYVLAAGAGFLALLFLRGKR
jgi:hypothetical protein